MYGMIHQAAREMALAHLGESEWLELLQKNGLSGQHFIGVDYYSDEQTMSLVTLIAARLDFTMEDALYQFGRFWIAFAGASAYGRVLSMAGSDLESFLDNLDRMHASIKSNMPLAKMPSFQVLASDRGSLRVLYASERTGLAPFVAGILAAVADRFGESVGLTWSHRDDGIVFEILREAAAA